MKFTNAAKPGPRPGTALATLLLAVAGAITAHAQTFSVLYNFGAHSGDPVNPVYTGLLRKAATELVQHGHRRR